MTREQANHVYQKTELGEVINTETLPQELEHKRQLNRIVDTSRETNPYRELIVNNSEKIVPLLAQMEQWSILSNTLNYIQYGRCPKNYHSLGISTVNKCRKNLGMKEERDLIELDFGSTPDILKEEFLDMYKGIQSEILNTTRFDENSDLSTMYLGKSDRSKNDKIKAEESFPISEQGYMLGKLLDGTECQILLDTGTSESFMSKSYYMTCKLLYSLPKFTPKTWRIQVGYGQFVSVLFIIPVIIDVHGHRFEIYTLVSEIHENIELILGNKNVFELQGVINLHNCCFKFLNRSLPIFPRECIMLKPKEQKLIKVKTPFIDEISGLAIIKLLDGSTYSTMLLKLKFIHNAAILDIVNNGTETIIFKPEVMLGIADLRSLSYYKIKQGVLQQNLSKYYRFERADAVWEHFNKFINTLKREREQKELEESYPWLDPSDERKYITDQEILDKYIDLGKSCLTQKEKKEVMEMLYKYKEAFSLRDEIGTCPNIEVEIDVTDKSPFFIRSYHVKEEAKALTDKEMKWLCYLGILKEGFSA